MKRSGRKQNMTRYEQCVSFCYICLCMNILTIIIPFFNSLKTLSEVEAVMQHCLCNDVQIYMWTISNMSLFTHSMERQRKASLSTKQFLLMDLNHHYPDTTIKKCSWIGHHVVDFSYEGKCISCYLHFSKNINKHPLQELIGPFNMYVFV